MILFLLTYLNHFVDKRFRIFQKIPKLRNIIGREIYVNLLIYREFVEPFYARLIIEKDVLKKENANKARMIGDIIKSKDDLINKLYQDNWLMHQQLLRQENIVEKATKYEKERNKIMEDNENMHNEVEQIKKDHNQKECDI